MRESTVAAAIASLVLLMLPLAPAQAADLNVIAGGGIAGSLNELAAQFEHAAGHKLAITYGATPDLIKQINSGAPVELVVVPREVLDGAGVKARLASSPMPEIARVGLGVAVRAGAPKPDISTPEALKQALLKAQSITSLPASAAGANILRVFDRLGIAEEMKAKTRAQTAPGDIAKAVARGDAELGLFLTNVLTAPGVDVVGPFPAPLQQELTYVAAVATDSRQADAARAFIATLTMPAAAALIKAKGMEPAGR